MVWTHGKMGKYTEVKSKFIKEKLNKADWKRDKEYIDDLIYIEKYILGKKFGLGVGYKMKALEGEYPEEYKTIFKELKPEIWEKIQEEREKEEKKEKIEEEKEQKQQKSLAQREKEDWIKAGGIVR